MITQNPVNGSKKIDRSQYMKRSPGEDLILTAIHKGKVEQESDKKIQNHSTKKAKHTSRSIQ